MTDGENGFIDWLTLILAIESMKVESGLDVVTKRDGTVETSYKTRLLRVKWIGVTLKPDLERV